MCGCSLLGPCKSVSKGGYATDWGPALGAVSREGVRTMVESEASAAKPDFVS
jgi:hypothetical protein